MSWTLIVPGPSDYRFWRRLRSRGLLPTVHAIITANGDDRLIADALDHDRAVTSAGGRALFLPDLDTCPCVTALRQKLTGVPQDRIIAARRSLEAWYLADAMAVNQVLPRAGWKAVAETDRIAQPKNTLKELYRKNYPRRNRDYRETDFAPKIAEFFDLQRAAKCSSSLRRLLKRLEPEQEG